MAKRVQVVPPLPSGPPPEAGSSAAEAAPETTAVAPPPIPKMPPMSALKAAHSAAPVGLRDKEEALRCFLAALEENPNDSFTYHKLGLLYEEEFRDKERAKECFERAIETNSRNAPAYNSLGLHYKPTDKNRALEYFQMSIAVDPEYGRAHKNMGLLYLHEFNDLTKARLCFAECLRVDPNNASAYVSMGQMCERQKEYEAAKQYYEMSIQCDSRNPIGYFRLGVLLHTKRDFQGAKQQYELAVRAQPTDIRFLVKLAKLVEGEPFFDHVLARKCYRTARHYNPGEPWLSGRIAFIEDKLLPRDEVTNELKPLPPDADAFFEEDVQMTPLGSTIEMTRQGSSNTSSDGPAMCPRRHKLMRIAAKPLTYKPQATWACEECHKSIGGLELRVSGAYHCAICKYDLCSTCAGKPKTAHVLPDEPALIGEGAFGEVYREYDPTMETYVAVKYVRTPNHSSQVAVQKEVKIMRLFAHSPYIVKVLRMEVERRMTRVYLELMAGSVASQIERGGPVHETQARVWIHDALRGLATLHNATRPVLHRDIKPENLLLTSDGRVKLSDFGLSKNMEGTNIAQTLGVKGTPLYVAPEIYHDPPKFTYACDIWALACSWISMVTGHRPWHGVFTTQARFENIAWQFERDPKLKPPIPEFLTPEARQLIDRMLDRDRRKRPTAEMIIADDYFSRQDLLERSEPQAVFEARRDALLAERYEAMRTSSVDGQAESGQLLVLDGINMMTPATPTAAFGMEPGGGLFPAVDTSTVILAPPSVPSWGSIADLDGSAHTHTAASSPTRGPISHPMLAAHNHSSITSFHNNTTNNNMGSRTTTTASYHSVGMPPAMSSSTSTRRSAFAPPRGLPPATTGRPPFGTAGGQLSVTALASSASAAALTSSPGTNNNNTNGGVSAAATEHHPNGGKDSIRNPRGGKQGNMRSPPPAPASGRFGGASAAGTHTIGSAAIQRDTPPTAPASTAEAVPPTTFALPVPADLDGSLSPAGAAAAGRASSGETKRLLLVVLLTAAVTLLAFSALGGGGGHE